MEHRRRLFPYLPCTNELVTFPGAIIFNACSGVRAMKLLLFNRMFTARLLFVSLLLLVLNGLQAQTDALDQKWRKAMALDSAGKYSQALRMIEPFLAEKEYEYQALMARSSIYFYSMERYQDALADVGAAMELEPDSAKPYLNRSSFYLTAGMFDRAVADLDEALRRSLTRIDSISAYLNKGAALGHMRRFQEAIDVLDLALVLDPDEWTLRFNKAAHLDEMDRTAEAKRTYLELHADQPEELMILNNLGFLTSRTGEHEEALEWFSKAQAIAPDDPIVLNNLGYAQLLNDRTDEALKSVQRSIKLSPGNSYAYRNLGLIHKEREEKDKACTAFELALEKGFTALYGAEVEQLHKAYCK